MMAMSLHWQLLVCTPVIVLFGLPHGAADWHVARRVFAPRLGRAWPLAFGAYYGLLMAVAGVGAWLAPAPAMLVFLGVSVWHFGTEDAQALGLSGSPAAILSLGAVPIAAPALFWPEQYGLVLRTLGVATPGDACAIRLIGGGAVAAAAAASVVAVVRTMRWRLGLEQAAVLALQVFPPLVAFTLYFCAVHGPRHLAALPADCRLPHWPVTLAAALIIAAAAALAASARHAGLDWAATQAVLWGLAALTLPHLVLARLSSPMLMECLDG